MVFHRFSRPLLVLAPFVVAAACAADPGDDPKGDGSSAISTEAGTTSGSSSDDTANSGTSSGTGTSSGAGSSGASTPPPMDAAASGSGSDDAMSDTADVSVAPPPPSCPTCILQLDYECAAPTDPTMEIKPWFKITNTGQMAQGLSELTIRYWYAVDADSGGLSQDYACDYAQVDVPGGSNTSIGPDVKATFGTATPSIAGADSYMETSFSAAAGSIPAGLTAQVQMRFHKTGYSGQYVQAGDYSFNPSDTAFTPSLKVTLYRNGTLIWGTEPGGAMPAGDP
jgi:endoglucanase